MFALKQEGYQSFNMGVAPFAGLGSRPDAPLTERALGFLFAMNWFVSNQGLRRYKVKFDPVWQDRFIALSRRAAGSGKNSSGRHQSGEWLEAAL
jgi:phosphatidylglycerol lysyltransferase